MKKQLIKHYKLKDQIGKTLWSKYTQISTFTQDLDKRKDVAKQLAHLPRPLPPEMLDLIF